MNVKSTILLFLLFFQLSFSQDIQIVIDQKKAELAISSTLKQRAAIFSDLTWYYASVSIDSALAYGSKAIKSAEELGDKTLLSQVYSDLGAVHFRNNDFKNSEKNYYKSYQIRKEQFNKAGIAKLNNNLATVYQNTFQYKKAMQMYLEALDYFEITQDFRNVNVTKGNLGVLFTDLKDYRNAEKYLQECVKYFENQEKSVEVSNKLCENYLNLGKVYQMKKNFQLAEVYFNKSNAICQQVGNKQGIAYSNRNLANLLTIKKQYTDSAALEKIKISQKYREELNSKLDRESNQLEFAQGLITEQKFLEAKQILLRILPVFEKEKSKENQVSAYKLLTNVYQNTNQSDSADYYFNQYLATNEKLIDNSVRNASTELEKKYQVLKKDKEIMESKNSIFKRNIYIFFLLGLLLVGSGAAFSIFRHRKKNEKIKLQKEILHQQDLATKAVMNAEDNERKRMATHLHDGVAQLLGAANMNVESLSDFRDDEPAFDKILGKTKNILDDAITDVRSLSHQMMPNMLIKSSLANALQDLIEKSDSPKLHINLKMEGLQDDLDKNIQIVMYRIIQECINNTIKHSSATGIDIIVRQNENLLETLISDNGVGFNISEVSSKSSGLGLENIKSRIDMLKGKLEVNSVKGAGTKISVKIPLI